MDIPEHLKKKSYQSIRAQVIRLGEREWHKFREENRPVDSWQGCLLVNPLCPDDLCVLPHNHVGTEQGWHCLGTDAYDSPYQYIRSRSVFFMAPEGSSLQQIVDLGWRKQKELFPEDGNSY